jgi:hypothetical protein
MKLNSLTNLNGVLVHLIDCNGSFKCSFTIEFFNLNKNIPNVQIDSSALVGNELTVRVTEKQKGSPAEDIIGSPFTLTIYPNITNAAFTNAYGEGLFYGVAGISSNFRIQSKDAYGNNRLFSQDLDIYKVHAFIPSADYDSTDVTVDGIVTYNNDSCFGHCGGVYDVVFTPKISGTYTICVMLGNKLEIQNITTSWNSSYDRKGYFTLSFGECNELYPCKVSKQIAWNADGAAVKEAVESLPGVGKVEVTFSHTSDYKNFAWSIKYLTACDIPQLNLGKDSTVPVKIETAQNGECSMISTTPDKNMAFPFANNYLTRLKFHCTTVYSRDEGPTYCYRSL